MSSKIKKLVIGVILIILLTTFYFFKTSNDPKSDAPEASLRLSWIPQGTFSGDYMALSQGFWSKNNINIEVRPGGFEYDSIKTVASKIDTFGIASGPEILEARANGVPVIMIAASIPYNPIGWVSKKGSGIKKPADFIGHKIGAQIGTHTEVTLNALFKHLGLDAGNLNRIPIKYDYTPFLAGAIDVAPVYLIDQVVEFKAKGVELNIINPRKYGISLDPGNVYFTHEDTISNNPELVKKFLIGAAEGWKYAYKNQKLAAEAILPHTAGGNLTALQAQIKTVFNFIVPNNGDYLGIYPIDPIALEKTEHQLKIYGQLSKEFSIEGSYNNSFFIEK